jgi:hypothetical protein
LGKLIHEKTRSRKSRVTAEIETGMAEKAVWDQANRRQKLGLVWKNRKKISQIIKVYFYLPFFLLIILCHDPNSCCIAGKSFLVIIRWAVGHQRWMLQAQM